MSVTAALVDVRRIAHGPTRTLFIGLLVKSIGSGLTLSLITVYLVKVRDLPVLVAGMLLAWQALLTLAVSPIVGTLVDRRGPRPVLLVALLIEALSLIAFGQVTTVQQAFAVMSAVAVGGAGIWGPTDALLARLVPSQDRSTAFGFQFMLLNIGLGLGGLISATIVDDNRPVTFEWLYTMTGLSFLALFIAVLAMGDVGGLPVAKPPADAGTDEGAAGPQGALPKESDGWAAVLRDQNLLRYGVVALLLLTFGYGCVESGVGLFMRDSLGLPTSRIGLVFAANTAVIVVMQLFMISFVNGRSRAQMLAGVGLLWAVTWTLFSSALTVSGWAAVGVLILAMSVFAVGETLWSPVAPALLNELAPEHLRGRYNSFQSLLWGVSGAVGPLVTAAFLSADLGGPWAVTLAVGCLVAALVALRMRTHLTPEQDGMGESEESPDDDPDAAGPHGEPGGDPDPSYSMDGG